MKRLLVLLVIAVAALTGFVPQAADAAGSRLTGPRAVIDPDATGSITLHKFVRPASAPDLPNDGSRIDPAELAGLTPIPGVEFTLHQVDVDLTTPGGWLAAASMTPEAAEGQLTGAPRVVTTGADGIAAADNLAVGLYLVTETAVGMNNITFRGDPFLVSIPRPHRGGWLYDVHVYPKNTVTPITKHIDDSGANVLGDVVTWTIRSRVPVVDSLAELSMFGFIDKLDARLEFVDLDVRVGQEPMRPSRDFDLEQVGQRITVTFTRAGLVTLHRLQGAPVVVSLRTRVIGLGNGSINNQAAVFVHDTQTQFVSEVATTKWGALTLVKHAEGDRSNRLAGAEFDLYATRDGERVGSALKVSPLVTGADGSVTVAGLRAGDYLLVETKAPDGYLLDTRPIPVTVSAGSVSEAVVVMVGDPKEPAGELPFTGAAVRVWIVAGVGLIGIGLLLMVPRRRRRRS